MNRWCLRSGQCGRPHHDSDHSAACGTFWLEVLDLNPVSLLELTSGKEMRQTAQLSLVPAALTLCGAGVGGLGWGGTRSESEEP